MDTEPTNILVIMSDQHSRHVLGCYGNGIAHTPNLDALAARGTRFANAYCNFPICVPSRASFATGRYAHQIGSWDNASPYIGTEAASWGRRLTAQGHRVTTIGKLHYRNATDPTGFPDQRRPMHVLDGEGDLYGLLRGAMPTRPHSRRQVLEARAGESDYTRYDRAIASDAAQWLRQEGRAPGKPWRLFVSFVTPHFPLVAPPEHVSRFDPDALQLPVQGQFEEWPHHPALDRHRQLQALDTPFDERTLRNALAAYYGLVSFTDEQVGRVLQALDEAGLRENTRVVYTSDHGEMLGEHGMWWKSSLYEASVGVPMLVAGPDVPTGVTRQTNVSLVDAFPTIVEGVGAELEAADADLPGRSLWRLAREADHSRTLLAEYHAIFAVTGAFMVLDERYTYHYFVDLPRQLFDLQADSEERRDLAGDPAQSAVLARMERQPRAIGDPEAVNRRAFADQLRKIAAAGRRDAVVAGGVKIPYTPAPTSAASAP